MTDFHYQQRERLFVEQEIKYWARRYTEIKNPKLREEVDKKVKDIVNHYDTQARCAEYHLDRYERMKRITMFK